MNISSLLLVLAFLSNATLLEACEQSDEHDFTKLGYLKQASAEQSIPELPADLLGLISREFLYVSSHGVLITNGTHRKWVYLDDLAALAEGFGEYAAWKFVDPLAAMRRFRDGEGLSQANITAFRQQTEDMKKGLLKKLSAQWQDGLEDLLGKAQRQSKRTWDPAKAYWAGLFARWQVGLSVAFNAGRDGASKAAGGEAGNNAWTLSWRSAWHSAWNGTKCGLSPSDSRWVAPLWADAYEAAQSEVSAGTAKKLELLTSPPFELGSLSYDLAELFALLWLTEHGQLFQKKAFETAYDVLLGRAIEDQTIGVEEITNDADHQENIFKQALEDDLKALKDFVLAG